MKPVRRKLLPKYITEETDKRGVVYVYFRRKGQKKIRMSGVPWTEPFMADYRALLAGEEVAQTQGKKLAGKGTFRKLCEDYFESTVFCGLDPRTQHVRRLILEKCLDEPLHKDKPDGRHFSDLPLAQFTGKAVRALRDRKAKTAPESANGRIKALRQVFAFAIEDEQMDKNPARDINYIKTGSQGFHSWSIAEVEKFEERHPIGTKPRLAMALLLYTGQRRSDIVLFGRQHLNKGWLKFTQVKNQRNKPVTLEIPLRPELRKIIDASPCGDLTFLVTEFGKGFTANGFGNWFRTQCDLAGLTHCSAHGLRKAAASRLAEGGATEQQIMAITGHSTSKEVTRYTKAARQKVMAAQAFGVEEDEE